MTAPTSRRGDLGFADTHAPTGEWDSGHGKRGGEGELATAWALIATGIQRERQTRPGTGRGICCRRTCGLQSTHAHARTHYTHVHTHSHCISMLQKWFLICHLRAWVTPLSPKGLPPHPPRLRSQLSRTTRSTWTTRITRTTRTTWTTWTTREGRRCEGAGSQCGR